jgi:hypothetical protein
MLEMACRPSGREIPCSQNACRNQQHAFASFVHAESLAYSLFVRYIAVLTNCPFGLSLRRFAARYKALLEFTSYFWFVMMEPR